MIKTSSKGVPLFNRAALLAGVLGSVACTGAESDESEPHSTCGTESGTGCWPEADRVDTYTPTFSNPTAVTNPLFPILNLHSALLLGNVDGEPFRVETTLLPTTKSIDWKGTQVTALQSQYVAFIDGRIEEVALDWYVQDDLGAVWYLGEDVFNYADGAIADREGTWLTDKDGPPAMIMPASPAVGQVYRPENAPGIVFEEVRVKEVGVAFDGPLGTVGGCMVADELHMDGTHEDKVFCPSYGEFYSGSNGDIEAIALAVPADGLSPSVPAELAALSSSAEELWTAGRAGDFAKAQTALDAITTAWTATRSGAPNNLAAEMDDAIASATAEIAAQDAVEVAQAAIEIERWASDLRLRHQPKDEIDRERFGLWARQILLDVDLADGPGVLSDATTLEWMRERIAHTFDAATLGEIDAQLAKLRTAADGGDLAGAKAAADALLALVPAG